MIFDGATDLLGQVETGMTKVKTHVDSLGFASLSLGAPSANRVPSEHWVCARWGVGARSRRNPLATSDPGVVAVPTGRRVILSTRHSTHRPSAWSRKARGLPPIASQN